MASEPVIGTVLSIDVDALILGRAGSDAPFRIPLADILPVTMG
jgi:hypothetical protein